MPQSYTDSLLCYTRGIGVNNLHNFLVQLLADYFRYFVVKNLANQFD